MKWLGTRKVALKSLIMPGNFAATKAAARIMDLASSIREHGIAEPPAVEAKTMRLIFGHDRIAALLTLKETKVEVRLWEGSPQEFRRLQIAENLHRRQDDRDALLAEYVRSEEARIIELTHDVAGTSVPTTQTVKRQARERVAAAAGIKPASVRKAEQRAAKAAEPEEPDTSLDLPPDFETLGVTVSPDDRAVLLDAIEQTGRWAASATRILTELTTLEKFYDPAYPQPLRPAAFAAIREACQRLGHVIRSEIPVSVCPYCKLGKDWRKTCTGCSGTGFVGKQAVRNAPAETKAVKPPRVMTIEMPNGKTMHPVDVLGDDDELGF
jgi:hypothetical protein